jgi:hypothetical protein
MFSYRFFLKQAWNITKRYKHLWFFGLFVSFLYASGEYQIIGSFLKQDNSGTFVDTWLIVFGSLFSSAFWLGIIDLSSQNPALLWTFISLSILLLAILIIILYISISSQAALVNQSAKIIRDKKKLNHLTISDGLKNSRKWFWPVLWLNLATKFIITLCFFILSIPLFFTIITNSVFNSLIYGILFIIFLPIALFISFTMKYAIASCVIEGKTFMDSIRKGIKIFNNNWLVSFEMAFILFIISFFVGLFALLFVTIFFVSLYVLGMLATSVTLVVLSLILTIATMVIVASLLGVFQTATWTGLFLHLNKEKGRSKLERFFKRK